MFGQCWVHCFRKLTHRVPSSTIGHLRIKNGTSAKFSMAHALCCSDWCLIDLNYLSIIIMCSTHPVSTHLEGWYDYLHPLWSVQVSHCSATSTAHISLQIAHLKIASSSPLSSYRSDFSPLQNKIFYISRLIVHGWNSQKASIPLSIKAGLFCWSCAVFVFFFLLHITEEAVIDPCSLNATGGSLGMGEMNETYYDFQIFLYTCLMKWISLICRRSLQSIIWYWMTVQEHVLLNNNTFK